MGEQLFHEFKLGSDIAIETQERCQSSSIDCGFASSDVDGYEVGLDGEELSTVWCLAKFCNFDACVPGGRDIERIV